MDKDGLNKLISQKINDIFYEYQKQNGIESGDISPDELLELENIQDQLSNLIIRVCENNQ